MNNRHYTIFIFFCVGLCLSNKVLGNSLNMAVASNFMTTAKILIRDFESKHPYRIKPSFGSSGKLAAQIMNGAPFHLFLSADQKMPNYLVSKNIGLKYSQFTYAIGTLSLCTDSVIGDQDVRAILRPTQGKRLAFANEKLAPYGYAARQTLNTLDIKESSNNKWIRADNVAQVFQFLVSKTINLAFVAQSQITHNKFIQANHCITIPDDMYSPISQDAILLQKGANSQSAKSFLNYLKLEQTRRLIKQFGYK